MDILKKAWNWLVISSEDPQKVALTAKGILTGVIPLILLISGNFGFSHALTQDTAGIAVNTIGDIITSGLGVVSLAMTIYGLFRKLKNTFTQG